MSEFEKVQCTCSHGYTCRAMTDPNCCAHSCDYNDLLDAFNAIQADRDAFDASLSAYEKILSELVTTDGLICSTSRWYYSERYAELSELSPQHHLAAHDAEVAANAVIEFSDHLVDIGQLRSAYPAEEYAAQLRAKAQQ